MGNDLLHLHNMLFQFDITYDAEGGITNIQCTTNCGEVATLQENGHNVLGILLFPSDPSQLGHIFRKARGHFADDTPANRQELVDTTADRYRVGTDKDGNDVYLRTRPDGRQVWVKSRNDVVQNGGLSEAGQERVWSDSAQDIVRK
jgi:hypothetical protein